MNIENNLANFSFLTLFASLIFFWIGTSFNNFLNIKRIAKYFVLISNVLLSFWLILRWKESGHFPLSNLYESLMFLSWCFTLSNLLLENPSSFMVRNSKASESLAAYLSALDGFAPQEQVKQNQLGISRNPLYNSINKRNKRNVEIFSFDSFSIVGAVSIPSALLTNAFATFTLPKEMQEASSLVPALQSNWLMMHVTVMILSYATLILGSLLSIAFLIVTFSQNSHNFLKARDRDREKEGLTSLPPTEAQELALGTPRERVARETAFGELFSFSAAPSISARVSPKVTQEMKAHASPDLSANKVQAESLFAEGEEEKGQVLLSFLDNLSYRFLGFGFPLLTIGILSGAVWANEAWGSYWSWDPKETWAFLTWLVFAIYLHLRLSYGLEGEKPAYVASFGFVIVWICFLGVNFLGEGLHSYGWIVKS